MVSRISEPSTVDPKKGDFQVRFISFSNFPFSGEAAVCLIQKTCLLSKTIRTCNKKCYLLIIGGFCFHGMRFDDRAGVRMLQDTLQRFLISIGSPKHRFDNLNFGNYSFAEGRAWLKLRVSILVGPSFFGLQHFWSRKPNHSSVYQHFPLSQ